MRYDGRGGHASRTRPEIRHQWSNWILCKGASRAYTGLLRRIVRHGIGTRRIPDFRCRTRERESAHDAHTRSWPCSIWQTAAPGQTQHCLSHDSPHRLHIAHDTDNIRHRTALLTILHAPSQGKPRWSKCGDSLCRQARRLVWGISGDTPQAFRVDACQRIWKHTRAYTGANGGNCRKIALCQSHCKRCWLAWESTHAGCRAEVGRPLHICNHKPAGRCLRRACRRAVRTGMEVGMQGLHGIPRRFAWQCP